MSRSLLDECEKILDGQWSILTDGLDQKDAEHVAEKIRDFLEEDE